MRNSGCVRGGCVLGVCVRGGLVGHCARRLCAQRLCEPRLCVRRLCVRRGGYVSRLCVWRGGYVCGGRRHSCVRSGCVGGGFRVDTQHKDRLRSPKEPVPVIPDRGGGRWGGAGVHHEHSSYTRRGQGRDLVWVAQWVGGVGWGGVGHISIKPDRQTP